MERKLIGYVVWEEVTRGRVPVYDGDLPRFDPTEELPTDDEMDRLVSLRNSEPLSTTTTHEWEVAG